MRFIRFARPVGLRWLLTCACMGYSMITTGQALDVSLSGDAAQLRYFRPFGSRIGGGNLDVGFLYTSSNDALGMLGLQVQGEAGSASPGLVVGVGMEGFTASIDDNNVLSLALAGRAHYSPPAYNRLGIGGEIYFSPDIVTFLDANRFIDLDGRLEYEILPETSVYLGYRMIKADMNSGRDETLDEGGHIGFRITF